MGLLTTTVGSFPKPAELRRARWKLNEGEIDEAQLESAEERALRDVLRLQETLGLDLLVDGQMDRGDMLGFFAERLEGLEPAGLVRCFDNRYYRKPRVVGPIERPQPITVQRWKTANELAARPVKAILTGPYTLMDWSFDEYYLSREKCCFAFAEVLRREALDLLRAGATEIQIDEPAISTRPSEMYLAAEALSRVTAGLRDGARTWTHVCYGNYAPVIGWILGLEVDVVMLELANSAFAIDEALDSLPDGKMLGAGVIDVLSPEVETPERIRSRVKRLLRTLPPERLWLVPDAGLRTLTPGQARSKLSAMVEAAASL